MKKILYFLGCCLLMMVAATTGANAQATITIDISASTDDATINALDGVAISGGVITISDPANNYVITGSHASRRIVVNVSGGEVNITLNGVSRIPTTLPAIITSSVINAGSAPELPYTPDWQRPDVWVSTCAFSIVAGSNVTLTVVGDNVLASGASNDVAHAGIQVSQGASLIINGNGKLIAIGGCGARAEGPAGTGGGAGIGGSSGDNRNAGDITIESGTVWAIGGDAGGNHSAGGAAGIGGGGATLAVHGGGSYGTIRITGGDIQAWAGWGSDGNRGGGGAGIGGGGGGSNAPGGGALEDIIILGERDPETGESTTKVHVQGGNSGTGGQAGGGGAGVGGGGGGNEGLGGIVNGEIIVFGAEVTGGGGTGRGENPGLYGDGGTGQDAGASITVDDGTTNTASEFTYIEGSNAMQSALFQFVVKVDGTPISGSTLTHQWTLSGITDENYSNAGTPHGSWTDLTTTYNLPSDLPPGIYSLSCVSTARRDNGDFLGSVRLMPPAQIRILPEPDFSLSSADSRFSSIDNNNIISFANLPEGSAQPDAVSVTITNLNTIQNGSLNLSLGTILGNIANFGSVSLSSNTVTPDGTATFSVRPNNGLSAGTYTLSIPITANYINSDVAISGVIETKTVSVSFTVQAVPQESDLQFSPASVTYGVGTWNQGVTVTASSTSSITFAENAFTVRYRLNPSGTPTTNVPTVPGVYQILVDVAASDTYIAASLDLGTFTINQRSIEDATITVAPFTFTGSPQTIQASNVTVRFGEEAPLTAGTDFTISQITDGAALSQTNAGAYLFNVNGTGNYSGVSPATFNIAKRNQEDWAITGLTGTYTFGQAAITLGTNATGLSGTGDVTYTSSNASVATISGNQLTIIGAGTFIVTANKAEDNNHNARNGVQSGTITVNRKDASASDFSLSATNFVYDGNQKSVTVGSTLGHNTSQIGVITIHYVGVPSTVYPRSTTAPANAGEYEVYITSTQGTGYNAITDDGIRVGAFTIDKATTTGVPQTQQVLALSPATSYQFHLLSLLPQLDAPRVFGTITYNYLSHVPGSVISGTPTISENSALNIPVNASLVDGATATVTVRVSSLNYNNFDVVVTVQAVSKTPVDIVISLPDEFVYDGTPKGFVLPANLTITERVSGTLVTGISAADLVLLYEGTGNYNSPFAPTNVGEYKLYVNIAQSNLNYTSAGGGGEGSHEFSILPATITQRNVSVQPVPSASTLRPETPTVASTAQFTGTAVWDEDTPLVFDFDTHYTAIIELTPTSNYTLDGIDDEDFFVVNDAVATYEFDDENGVGVITAVFRKTRKENDVVVSIREIPGIPVPVAYEDITRSLEEVDNEEYSGTVEWIPAVAIGDNFEYETVYTAITRLTAKEGYTFDGVPANFFYVPGEYEPSTNLASSGVVTTIFPPTDDDGSESVMEDDDFVEEDPETEEKFHTISVNIPTPTAAFVADAANVTETVWYTGTVAWSPALRNDGSFDYDTEYTAIIRLTPKSGLSFRGVPPDFFRIDGVDEDYVVSVANVVNSGVVRVVFTPTAKLVDIQEMGLAVPYVARAPEFTVNTAQYKGDVVWSYIDDGDVYTELETGDLFETSTVYSAVISNIEVHDEAAYTLLGLPANFFTIGGIRGTSAVVTDIDNITVTVTFPPTRDEGDVMIDDDIINGVGIPIAEEESSTKIDNDSQYTGTIIWEYVDEDGDIRYLPSGADFAFSTVYTAVITLTPKEGYTFEDVPANFFKVAGALPWLVNNSANGNVVRAEFPRTRGELDDPALEITDKEISGLYPIGGAEAITFYRSPNRQYEGEIRWFPALVDNKFAYETEYLAVFNLTGITPYTFDSVTEDDYFTVITGPANEDKISVGAAFSGIFIVTFPETAPNTFPVTVVRGSSDKLEYEELETVYITAGADGANERFSHWEVVSGGVSIANANNRTTTFTMPANAVTVEAVYIQALDFVTYTEVKWDNTILLNASALASRTPSIAATDANTRWFRNGAEIFTPGTSGPSLYYSAGHGINDKLASGVYHFEITVGTVKYFSTNWENTSTRSATELKSYPNPVVSGNMLTIEGIEEGSLIEIFNMTGIRVLSTIAVGEPVVITLNVPAGMYVLRTNIGELKIVVNN